MDYTFYDETTGDIKSISSSSEKPSEKNGKYVVGRYDPKEYRIVDGVPTKKSKQEIESAEVERAWIDFRAMRNAKLKASDYTQLDDVHRNKAAWATYRQQLRDLPDVVTDPRDVTWPEPPK